MVQLEIMSRIMFSKLTYRLHNYQTRNPIEAQNFNITDSRNDSEKVYYIDLSYKQYDINIMRNYDNLIILINDRFSSKSNRFYIVPPMTINQEDIRFNSDRYMFKMNKDLIKMFKVVFKLKFHSSYNPYFETKNDILSQT